MGPSQYTVVNPTMNHPQFYFTRNVRAFQNRRFMILYWVYHNTQFCYIYIYIPTNVQKKKSPFFNASIPILVGIFPYFCCFFSPNCPIFSHFTGHLEENMSAKHLEQSRESRKARKKGQFSRDNFGRTYPSFS